MSYVRTKWIVTSKVMKWKRPYRYLVESIRIKDKVVQRHIKYVGVGVSSGWMGVPPEDAHPDWAKETLAEQDDAWGQYTKEETKRHGVSTRGNRTSERTFRKGETVILDSGHEVQMWADDLFWSNKNDKVHLDELKDASVEVAYGLHRLPPGMVKTTDEIYFSPTTKNNTSAYYSHGTKALTFLGSNLRGHHDDIDGTLVHEASHAYFHERKKAWKDKADGNMAKAKAKREKAYDKLQAKGIPKHKELKDGGVSKAQTPQWKKVEDTYHKEQAAVIEKADPGMYQFVQASVKEGGVTGYSHSYYSKSMKKYQPEWLLTYYGGDTIGFVNENLSESTKIWFGASRGRNPSHKAEEFPETYEAFQKLLEHETKGWNVPLDKKPPSARDLERVETSANRRREVWLKNVAKYQDAEWRWHNGKRSTLPSQPFHPGKRTTSYPQDNDKKQALRYRQDAISKAERDYWKSLGVDVNKEKAKKPHDKAGWTKAEVKEMEATDGMKVVYYGSKKRADAVLSEHKAKGRVVTTGKYNNEHVVWMAQKDWAAMERKEKERIQATQKGVVPKPAKAKAKPQDGIKKVKATSSTYEGNAIKIIRGKATVYDTNCGTKDCVGKAKARLKRDGYNSYSIKRGTGWDIYKIVEGHTPKAPPKEPPKPSVLSKEQKAERANLENRAHILLKREYPDKSTKDQQTSIDNMTLDNLRDLVDRMDTKGETAPKAKKVPIVDAPGSKKAAKEREEMEENFPKPQKGESGIHKAMALGEESDQEKADIYQGRASYKAWRAGDAPQPKPGDRGYGYTYAREYLRTHEIPATEEKYWSGRMTPKNPPNGVDHAVWRAAWRDGREAGHVRIRTFGAGEGTRVTTLKSEKPTATDVRPTSSAKVKSKEEQKRKGTLKEDYYTPKNEKELKEIAVLLDKEARNKAGKRSGDDGLDGERESDEIDNQDWVESLKYREFITKEEVAGLRHMDAIYEAANNNTLPNDVADARTWEDYRETPASGHLRKGLDKKPMGTRISTKERTELLKDVDKYREAAEYSDEVKGLWDSQAEKERKVNAQKEVELHLREQHEGENYRTEVRKHLIDKGYSKDEANDAIYDLETKGRVVVSGPNGSMVSLDKKGKVVPKSKPPIIKEIDGSTFSWGDGPLPPKQAEKEAARLRKKDFEVHQEKQPDGTVAVYAAPRKAAEWDRAHKGKKAPKPGFESKTVNRGHLRKQVVAGEMEAKTSYAYDGRVVTTAKDEEWKPAHLMTDGDNKDGHYNLQPGDFKSKVGGAYTNEDGTINLRVHSNEVIVLRPAKAKAPMPMRAFEEERDGKTWYRARVVMGHKNAQDEASELARSNPKASFHVEASDSNGEYLIYSDKKDLKGKGMAPKSKTPSKTDQKKYKAKEYGFKPSDKKEYTDLNGMKVGRWRCPEDKRGVSKEGYCAVHGQVEPIDIKKSEDAQEMAYDIRAHAYLGKHHDATIPETAKGMGCTEKGFRAHLKRKDPYEGITYRKQYEDMYGLKPKPKAKKAKADRWVRVSDASLAKGVKHYEAVEAGKAERLNPGDEGYEYQAARYILANNPVREQEVERHKGNLSEDKQPPQGIDHKVWRRAWKDAEKAGEISIQKTGEGPSGPYDTPKKPKDLDKPPQTYTEKGKTYKLIAVLSPEQAKPQAKALGEAGHDIKTIKTRDGKWAIYGVKPKEAAPEAPKPKAPKKGKAKKQSSTPWEEAGMTRAEWHKSRGKKSSPEDKEKWLRALAVHDDAYELYTRDKDRNPAPPMPKDPVTGKSRIATSAEREAAQKYREVEDGPKASPKGAVRIV